MKNITIKKRDGAPEFVLGSFGLKYDELKDYVNDKGYVNFDILKGQYGDYIKVSEYGLNKKEEGEIPF